MASVEGGNWRLKTIIILVLFVTTLYSSYGVFGSIQTADEFNEEMIDYSHGDNSSISNESLDSSYDYTDEKESGEGFIDILVGTGNFLTFGDVDNEWARLLFNIVTLICTIVTGYLIYTFIRDWIPFVG